jgi:hypothetical protein
MTGSSIICGVGTSIAVVGAVVRRRPKQQSVWKELTMLIFFSADVNGVMVNRRNTAYHSIWCQYIRSDRVARY